MKRGRPRSKSILTEVRHCDKHDQDCEYRQWRRGLDQHGNPRLVWICAQWQNEQNKNAYAQRKRSTGEDVVE